MPPTDNQLSRPVCGRWREGGGQRCGGRSAADDGYQQVLDGKVGSKNLLSEPRVDKQNREATIVTFRFKLRERQR
jgi:hypothetical protein